MKTIALIIVALIGILLWQFGMPWWAAFGFCWLAADNVVIYHKLLNL